jgi:hypothetical protein
MGVNIIASYNLCNSFWKRGACNIIVFKTQTSHYIVNMMYGQDPSDVICKWHKLHIINKMYHELYMEMEGYLGASFVRIWMDVLVLPSTKSLLLPNHRPKPPSKQLKFDRESFQKKTLR